jgi:hypothetical protein
MTALIPKICCSGSITRYPDVTEKCKNPLSRLSGQGGHPKMTFNQFHDGFYNGLLINGDSLDAFVSTDENERFVICAMGVVALLSGEIKAGNIIFDVEIRNAEEIDLDDIREVHGFPRGEQGDKWADEALLRAKADGLSLLSIGPSYGGNCLALAKSFTLVTEAEWIAQLSGSVTNPRA